MKAISIQHPYAHYILCGQKTVECRTWQTSYRGDILICSSAKPQMVNAISGHALCIARLDKIEPFTKKHMKAACLTGAAPTDCFAWHLENVRVVKPFAVKGKLNFYYVDDSKIEILDEDHLTEEEIDKWYDMYFYPLTYKGGGA